MGVNFAQFINFEVLIKKSFCEPECKMKIGIIKATFRNSIKTQSDENKNMHTIEFHVFFLHLRIKT